jgi:hypothetical protein
VRVDKLKVAEDEAYRFLDAAKKLRRYASQEGSYVLRNGSYYSCAPKQTGAVRRASMDLTRALAELRKPD